MSDANLPLIAGAGPVGLGAALFLALQGRRVRLVDSRTMPTDHAQSRALAVNPRTLRILEPTGLTDRILELGKPIRGAVLHKNGKVSARIAFDRLPSKYPFLVALSEATTERLLAEALQAHGGAVEWGARLAQVHNRDGDVEAALETAPGKRDIVSCPWVLAADGAHSTVREQLAVDFPGAAMAEPWHLADVPLRTSLAEDRAHVFFKPGAFVFLLRAVDPLRENPGGPVWRVISNRPEPLAQLTEAEVSGPAVWTSSFHITHRIVSRMAVGRVYFAGDAAHLHSPLGARGMNLGLEDAWVFAELVLADRLFRYDDLRRPVDQQVVRRVEFLSRTIACDSWWHRALRSALFPTALVLPGLRGVMLRTLSGLDHPLPEELTAPRPLVAAEPPTATASPR